MSAFFKQLSVLPLLSFTLLFAASGQSSDSNEVMMRRIIEMELSPSVLSQKNTTSLFQCYPVDEAPIVIKDDLLEIDRLIQKDGTFKNVDYQDKSRSNWKALKHLDYCRMLAIALHVFPSDVLEKSHAHTNCLKSLYWWLENKPRNGNWWNHDVYESQMLGNIGILLHGKDCLTADMQKAIVEHTKSIKPDKTGQNLMWMSWNTLLAGLLGNDASRIDHAITTLSKTIVISPPGKEGIQIDMSFQQHGPQLYQGNYGRHYLHSASKFTRFVHGTTWEDKAKTRLLERYLLDGTRWMCWGSLLDYSVWSRQISYYDRLQGADLLYVCDHMLQSGAQRTAEISEFSKSLITTPDQGKERNNEISGTRAFPLSDYAVHRSKSFLTTVRMSSTRTVIGEITNGDNLKGAYLSNGAMFTYKTGHEYDGIFPCWDWGCIPGTTTERDHQPKNWSGKKGGSPFASAMDAGVAAMTINQFGLTANKSWFFLPGRIVCLGSDISGGEKNGNIVTTIEQSLLSKTAPSKITSKKVNGIIHDKTLYLSDNTGKMTLEAGKRKGSWKDIRSNSPGDTVEKNVFLLFIDHGKNPVNGLYAYQVFPAFTQARPDIDSLWNKTSVIRHDKTVHAIASEQGFMAVFYTPDTLILPDGKKITVKEPCLLATSPTNEIKIRIPGKTEGSTEIEINGKPQKIILESASRE